MKGPAAPTVGGNGGPDGSRPLHRILPGGTDTRAVSAPQPAVGREPRRHPPDQACQALERAIDAMRASGESRSALGDGAIALVEAAANIFQVASLPPGPERDGLLREAVDCLRSAANSGRFAAIAARSDPVRHSSTEPETGPTGHSTGGRSAAVLADGGPPALAGCTEVSSTSSVEC